MSLKSVVGACVFLACSCAGAFSLPPSLVLGASVEGGDSSAAPFLAAPYADVRLSGTFGWRQAMGPGSYLAVASRASIAPYLTLVPGFVDSELLNVELGLPSGAGALIFDAGVESSLENQVGVGSYATPAWSAAYRFARGAGGMRPSLVYSGSYLWEQLGSDDHLSQSLQLTLDQSTSVRLETTAALQGSWELWTKEQGYDASGTPTGAPRQDWIITASAGARGFAFYTLDWALNASAGVRLSDASTSAPDFSQLVLPGGSRLTTSARASASWTPSSRVSLSINASAQDDWYFTREGINPDGSSSSFSLNVLALGGGLKADWTPDNAFYVVIEVNAARTFANDPGIAQWSGTFSAGIEYSF